MEVHENQNGEFCEQLQLVSFAANVVTVLFYAFSLEHLFEIVAVGEILSFPFK